MERKSGNGVQTRTWDDALDEPVAPLAIIRFERNDQLRLCDGLELIADQLPDDVDLALYETINQKLRTNLPVYLRNEEALFDCLHRYGPNGLDLPAVLDCIRREHASQTCHVDELQDNLDVLRRGRTFTNPDMVGYMLRFFFDSVRRHLAWEDLTVIPLASRSLTTDDLTNLSEILSENRKAISLNVV